eukprot:TRINITY_DN66328_c1_g1_i1.p1 TRINITY_DN66328_c1_g1~~TRINITY_DN66328_c1_g1_i1.p1  ORF type:complete len:227 (+),score=17.25 TRINITY_DN66328_c1_g1_i1:33-683(+)
MFVSIELTDYISLPPSSFTKDYEECVIDELNSKYTDRVLPNIGLCIAVNDLLSVGDAMVHPGDGSVWTQVRFREIVFRPSPNEVLVGRIAGSSPEGIQVSLGFFSEIHIPQNLMQNTSFYDPRQKLWFWSSEADDGSKIDLVYPLNGEIRFKVYAIHFYNEHGADKADTPATEAGDSSTAAKDKEAQDTRPYPMQITGNVQADGLGLTGWWIAPEY